MFELDVQGDPLVSPDAYEKPLRYGKRPEIHHIFRDDPKNPPKIISIFFVLAVLATVPVLLGVVRISILWNPGPGLDVLTVES